MAFTIKLEGLNKVLGDLNAIPTKVKPEVDAELEDASRKFSALAKRDAPADQGILRSEISYSRTGDLTFSVVSAALYAGYVEFGTRSQVHVPAGLEEVAAQVRAQKGMSSLGAKEAIFQWCQRQGIDKRLWYPIFIKIMTKGIKAHPYFFKQVAVIEPEVVKNIKRVIESLD